MTPKPDLDAIERRLNAATPGPWQWFGNTNVKSLYLATVHHGRRFVMRFGRWGMQGAQPRFQVDDRMVDGSTLVRYERPYRKDVDGIDHPDADLIAHAPEDLRALLAEVRTARLDGARAMREAILRVERWSAGGVQAILDLDPATVVGVATTVPDETLRAHEPPPCPGCAGDLAGLVDAVCPTCRAALTVAFAPGEVPRG